MAKGIFILDRARSAASRPYATEGDRALGTKQAWIITGIDDGCVQKRRFLMEELKDEVVDYLENSEIFF